jgi:CO/xanthine dehydrogenase FAD-binding subunit
MIGVFDYVRVGSVKEGCDLLAEHEGRARVFAGGTDLLVNIRNNGVSPDLLVDIKGIEPLGKLTVDAPDATIGACVPLNVIGENAAIAERCTALAQAALSVGSYQVRNRATLAGNVANASPAADTAPALLVLDAHVAVQGKAGGRDIPISELFLGVKKNSLAADEMITSIMLPSHAKHMRSAFIKKQRVRGHDLAVINMAGSLDQESGALRVAIGSCAVTPILLSIDSPIDCSAPIDELVARIDKIAQDAIRPIDDLRGSAAYRRGLIPVFLRRLLTMLVEREGGE